MSDTLTACQWFDGSGLCGQPATHVVPGSPITNDDAPMCGVHAARYSQAVRIEHYRSPAPKIIRPHPLKRVPREQPISSTCDYLVCGDDGRVRCDQPAEYRGVGSNRLVYCRRHAEWVQSLGHAVQHHDSALRTPHSALISPGGKSAPHTTAPAAESARAGVVSPAAPDATHDPDVISPE